MALCIPVKREGSYAAERPAGGWGFMERDKEPKEWDDMKTWIRKIIEEKTQDMLSEVMDIIDEEMERMGGELVIDEPQEEIIIEEPDWDEGNDDPYAPSYSWLDVLEKTEQEEVDHEEDIRNDAWDSWDEE